MHKFALKNNETLKARQWCRAFFFILLLLLPGCSEIRDFYEESSALRDVRVTCDGMIYSAQVALDAKVADALTAVGVEAGTMDIVTPALPLAVPADGNISVIRVTTEDVVTEQVIPFQSQTVRNESLAEGETRIVQQGQNGIRRITTRYTYEDGVLKNSAVVSAATAAEPVPEILMRGAKAAYSPININGRLIYISGGNAWMMESSTENRTPLLSTGDLDGRVLDLSSDGKWLLFSRTGKSEEINGLWMLDLSTRGAEPISLRVSNVLHFASWLPGEARRFLYSTVTPLEQASGWRAANDLYMQFVSDTGMLMNREEILPPDDSDTYSWWGTEFALSDDARRLLFATPERIGVIDRLSAEKEDLIRFTPYENTRSDWAWIPGFCWNAENDGFYFTFHGKTDGSMRTFDPADYHIASYDLSTGTLEVLVENAGPFSYPSASPVFVGGKSYLAWLQTDNPRQTDAERYHIMLSEASGKNPRTVYPPAGSSGYVTPQHLVWSPGNSEQSAWIAFLSDGNIWLVNPFAGISNQITSDGGISRFIWE